MNRQDKRQEKVSWRDLNGNIVCRGADCDAAGCDGCPISLQSIAFYQIQHGNLAAAQKALREALAIAPDFKTAWVNLAATYGQQGNHVEAYKAYSRAYALERTYRKALYGLAISCKNLARFDEAERYCSEFEAVAGRLEAEELRRTVREGMKTPAGKPLATHMDILPKLIAHAREVQFLGPNDRFPNIPEIICKADETCRKLLPELVKERCEAFVSLSWCLLAGAGAVVLWDRDFPTLQRKGIAESLLEPKGIFAMDEYVYSLMGIKEQSPEEEQFRNDLISLSYWILDEYYEGVQASSRPSAFFECMKAMFVAGMVCQMERMGMR